MNILNNRINHVKKNSCLLFNKIPRMKNTIKDKLFEKSYNNIYNKNTENSSTSRINTSSSIKKSIGNSKKPLFSRPYIKQLSQYCFLTLKHKDSNIISKLNDYINKNNEQKSIEKDDKTNIYFNLIKTYYDENGMKLKPKKTEVYPIDEIDYPKIIKSKKKKKHNNSLDENQNGNFLNFENKNKTMNENCNIYFAQIEKNMNTRNYTNGKLIAHKKIIKRENYNYNYNSINRKKKTPLNISSGEFIFKNNLKNPAPSPTTSEKSFNIFFQNKSDYIINDIQNNPIISGSVGNLNSGSNIIFNRNNNNYDTFSPNEKDKDNENSINNIMTYFNKKLLNQKNNLNNKISEIKLTEGFKSLDSINSKEIINYINNNPKIFQKKKISDSFDEIKSLQIPNNKSNLITSYADNFIIPKNNTHKYFFSNGRNFKRHNEALSWTKININTINNNNLNVGHIYNKSKISPKRLEKYFNPNQINKNAYSFKRQYVKNPPDIQVIDINNITFKKPFKLVKNIKINNNSTSNIKEINLNTNNINLKNNKSIISSYYDNNNIINKNKKQILSQNISYNDDKNQIETSSLINNKNKINSRNNKNTFYSYKIKYMKNKFKQNPYSFSNEKIKILHNVNSFNEKRKIKNEPDENINFNINNQNKYTINSYNIINNISNIDKNNQKEKIKKYLVQRSSIRNKKNKLYFSNNKPKEQNINNKNIEGILSPINKQSNISYQTSITEPSIIYNQIKIKNSLKPETGNKNSNQKIIIEKDKKGNKKMYILRKKLKEGVIKLKTKFDVQNKLGIKKDI